MSFICNHFRLWTKISRDNWQSHVVVTEAKVNVILALEALHRPIESVSTAIPN